MAVVQYSQAARFRCDKHGLRGSSVWVFPEKGDNPFVPFYACLHCSIEVVGKEAARCTPEQVEAIKKMGSR